MERCISPSGISARSLFTPSSGLNYSNFTIIDTLYTSIKRDGISLETCLGKDVIIKTPILASPMDRVTNSKVCIALALEGGIGVLHHNYKNGDTKDLECQALEMSEVKSFQLDSKNYPLATLDSQGRLRALFSVDTRLEHSRVLIENGFAAGADGVVVDTSQGFTLYAKEMLEYIAGKYPDKLLIGGNIATKEAAEFLADLKCVDAYRCGQGSGSMCTTAGAIGISRASATAVYECSQEKRMKNIADGGIKETGDIFKALALGSHAVMLGSLLAGTLEGPGEVIEEKGERLKEYRGMGSKEANIGGIRGYSRLPQGVSGKVPYRGSIHEWVPLIVDGLLSAMHVVNCRNIEELHSRMKSEELRFEINGYRI